MDIATIKAMQDRVQRGRAIYDRLDQALEELRQFNLEGIDARDGKIGPPDVAR